MTSDQWFKLRSLAPAAAARIDFKELYGRGCLGSIADDSPEKALNGRPHRTAVPPRLLR
jgi:hypothetical protein